MKIELDKLYEGWRNNLFPPSELKEIIERVSSERMEICNKCEHNSSFHSSIRWDTHCTICSCTLSAKTKCLSCECPVKKWLPLMTEQQEEEIENAESG